VIRSGNTISLRVIILNIDNGYPGDSVRLSSLTPRIYELGGRLPDDIRAFSDLAGCPDAYLPDSLGGAKASRTGTATTAMGDYPSLEGKPIKDLLTVLVEAERCAIRTYTDLCNMTFGKDHRTYDLSLAILNEEIEHEARFSEFLNEGPSGHFQRGAPGASPYVSRYLTAETGRANH
jgi:ferritin-like protein